MNEQLTKDPEQSTDNAEKIEEARRVAEAINAVTVRRGSKVKIRLSDDPDDIMELRVIINQNDNRNRPEEKTLLISAALGRAILDKIEGTSVPYATPRGQELQAEIISVDNTDNDL